MIEKHDWQMYRRLIAIQLQSQMQYRASFWLDVTSTFFLFMGEFSVIYFAFQKFGGLGGWQLGEVAFLYGLVEMSFALMDMFFTGFDPHRFGPNIRLGHFDQLLLRPININVQVLGSGLELKRLGRVAGGLLIFGYALSLVDMSWTWGKVLYLPLVVWGMMAFFGGIFIMGTTMTFWTVNAVEALNILTYGGSYLISYPIHIYTRPFRLFITYIFPVAFLNYYPALYFLDKPHPQGWPLWTSLLAPLVGTAVLLLSLRLWQFGIQHYQSTGS